MVSKSFSVRERREFTFGELTIGIRCILLFVLINCMMCAPAFADDQTSVYASDQYRSCMSILNEKYPTVLSDAYCKCGYYKLVNNNIKTDAEFAAHEKEFEAACKNETTPVFAHYAYESCMKEAPPELLRAHPQRAKNLCNCIYNYAIQNNGLGHDDQRIMDACIPKALH